MRVTTQDKQAPWHYPLCHWWVQHIKKCNSVYKHYVPAVHATNNTIRNICTNHNFKQQTQCAFTRWWRCSTTRHHAWWWSLWSCSIWTRHTYNMFTPCQRTHTHTTSQTKLHKCELEKNSTSRCSTIDNRIYNIGTSHHISINHTKYCHRKWNRVATLT